MNRHSFHARFGAFLALVLLGSISISAQGKWWHSERFRKELGLTSEQSRRLEDIFQAALPGLKTHKRALDHAESQLELLVEKGADPDVMDQVNLVEGARADLNKARTMMLLRMRRVLTTDQWARFTALHQAQEREQAGSRSTR